MNRQIILASVSPRRKQLMGLLGVKFKVVDSGYKEVMDDAKKPEALVKFLALGKAEAAAKKYPSAIIIAADTVVSFGGKAIGKPKNKKDAEKMLKSFRGKAQYVVTGVVVLDAQSKQVITNVVKMKIYFKKVRSQQITDYIKTGEPFDKAGGYGPIGTGPNLIQKIEGDFTAALGLPMGVVLNALEELGIKF